jgi:diacylglycerol kinase family enzyme
MDIEQQIKMELELFETEQTTLQRMQNELEANPKFAQFIEAKKNFDTLASTLWGNVEQAMIDNNIKSIKTDKITLTIAERVSFDIDGELLPAKYYKKVPNTTLIANTFKLEGKPVKGTSPRFTQYLMKRIK